MTSDHQSIGTNTSIRKFAASFSKKICQYVEQMSIFENTKILGKMHTFWTIITPPAVGEAES